MVCVAQVASGEGQHSILGDLLDVALFFCFRITPVKCFSTFFFCLIAPIINTLEKRLDIGVYIKSVRFILGSRGVALQMCSGPWNRAPTWVLNLQVMKSHGRNLVKGWPKFTDDSMD